MSATHEVRGVGHSVKRKEDARFLRGRGRYFDDITLPGMLHMEILRSPYAHARIISVDTSAAAALPGVVAVVTGELMAQHNLAWMPTLSGDTQAVLATDKVRYQGQEVACVIAESAYVAKDALELIEVEYDPLPAVTSPQQSSADDAPLIRDEKEGQTDNHVYHWEAATRTRPTAPSRRQTTWSRSTPSTRARTPRRWSAAAASQTSTRRPEGDDLPHVAGPARAPDAVRDRGGAAGAEHPHHQP